MNWTIWITIGGVEFKVRPVRLAIFIGLVYAAIRILS